MVSQMRATDGFARPLIGVTIGDPCGIGPEVTVKAWATGEVHKLCRPVLIGSVKAVEDAVRLTGVDLQVRAVTAPGEGPDSSKVLTVIDNGHLDPQQITVGRDNEACGRACGAWITEAEDMAKSGAIAGVVMGSVSSVAMRMAGNWHLLANDDPEGEYIFLLAEGLRVAHLTDHIPLKKVCAIISADLVEKALLTVHSTLERWGVPGPRIGVAGLNPHAMGEEEELHIRPGVERAVRAGVRASGPISPDAVFRHCIERTYDIVLAMYHDQGHIAVKTRGFAGNCALPVGRRPYLFIGTAHGTAFDIAGKGIADHTMMLSAMKTAGALASGRGFSAL